MRSLAGRLICSLRKRPELLSRFGTAVVSRDGTAVVFRIGTAVVFRGGTGLVFRGGTGLVFRDGTGLCVLNGAVPLIVSGSHGLVYADLEKTFAEVRVTPQVLSPLPLLWQRGSVYVLNHRALPG